MKACNVCRLTKEPGEFHRRASSADALAHHCKACDSSRCKARYLRDAERVRARNRAWWIENAERARERKRAWRLENIERVRERQQAWMLENAEYHRERQRTWRRENRSVHSANSAAYRADRFQRVPPWADRGAIADVYQRASFLTEILGDPYHVDHIIPLHGEVVSGLHVHTNLQILEAADNLTKSNKFTCQQ